jgi:hypothetical protein
MMTTYPDALDDLRHHWGGAYRINNPAPGSWIAQRRDGTGTIRADSSHALLEAIRIDYQVTPVPRQPGQEDDEL